MQDDDSEIEVVVPVEETDIDSLELGKTIWNEITAGVGIWESISSSIRSCLIIGSILVLSQHFNRRHQRGFDWFLLQIPLAFSHWFYGFYCMCGRYLMRGEMLA